MCAIGFFLPHVLISFTFAVQQWTDVKVIDLEGVSRAAIAGKKPSTVRLRCPPSDETMFLIMYLGRDFVRRPMLIGGDVVFRMVCRYFNVSRLAKRL